MRNKRTVLAVVMVGVLITLSGCSGLFGGTDSPTNDDNQTLTKSEVLTQAGDAYAETNSITVSESSRMDMTVNLENDSGETEEVTLRNDREIQSAYNFENRSYRMEGTVETSGIEENTRSFTRRYVDGTLYLQNSDGSWSSTTNTDFKSGIVGLFDQMSASEMQNVMTMEYDGDSGEYKFTADLTNQDTWTQIKTYQSGSTTSDISNFVSLAEEFTLTLKVDEDTMQYESIELRMSLDTTAEELRNEAGMSLDESITGDVDVEFRRTVEITGYDEEVTVEKPTTSGSSS